MKVGIITFSNATNIGALLQAYALQEYITLNNCCEVIHLNYSYTPTAKSTLTANPMGQKLHNLFHLKAYFISKNKTNKVSSFKNTFLHLSSRAYSNSIPINAEDCSVYITGQEAIICKKIKFCLSHYSSIISDFNVYKETVLNLESNFVCALKRIFD